MIPTGPSAAPIGRRVAAYALDTAIAAVVLGIGVGIGMGVWFASGADPMLVVLVVAIAWAVGLGWLAVYSAMQGGTGSIGQRVLAIRLVRVDDSAPVGFDSAPIGFGRALLRNVVWGLAGSIVVGYFTPLFDASGWYRGWHDKAGGAVMLDGRGAQAPVGASATATMPAPPVAPPVPPPPAPPILQAPSFDQLPPASMTGFAPAATASTGEPAPAVAPPGTLIAHVPGITSEPNGRMPVAPPQPVAAPAAVPPVAAPAAAAPAPAPILHAGAEASDELAATRVTRSAHGLVFVWDDGTRHTVGARTLFGRNPAPEAGAASVSVRDETLSLSKTHFEVDVAPDGAWITDRHSTNGVTLVRDGARTPLPPGDRIAVRAGDALEIGDRIVTLGGAS